MSKTSCLPRPPSQMTCCYHRLSSPLGSGLPRPRVYTEQDHRSTIRQHSMYVYAMYVYVYVVCIHPSLVPIPSPPPVSSSRNPQSPSQRAPRPLPRIPGSNSASPVPPPPPPPIMYGGMPEPRPYQPEELRHKHSSVDMCVPSSHSICRQANLSMQGSPAPSNAFRRCKWLWRPFESACQLRSTRQIAFFEWRICPRRSAFLSWYASWFCRQLQAVQYACSRAF